MRMATLVLALLIATRPAPTMAWQGSSLQGVERSSDPTPLYRVSFERGDAIAGVNSTSAVQLPFKCTNDGTIFVTFVGSVPVNSGLLPPLIPPLQFVSIAPPDRGQVFRLDQVPQLFVPERLIITHPTLKWCFWFWPRGRTSLKSALSRGERKVPSANIPSMPPN